MNNYPSNRPFYEHFNKDKQTNNNNQRQNNRSNQFNNRPNQGSQENNPVDSLKEQIKKNGKLATTLTVEEINLPKRAGYNIGCYFSGNASDDKCLNTNQLRKYFQQISSVKDLDNFEEQRKELYKVLPNIAYAVGRKVCPPKFYELMEVCISKTALVDEDDINAFVDFLTAVVAYSKLNSNN